MYTDLRALAEKTGVPEVSLRRMMTREELVRGEHYSADHGIATVFDEAKTIARLRELNVLKSPDRLA